MNRWLARARNERGFTLMEVSFAVGLFGIALVGLSVVFRSSLTTASTVRVSQLAKTLAQEKLEETRSLPFYVSQKEDTSDVDLLDRYFPDDANVATTPTGATGTYDPTVDQWTFTSTEIIDPENAPPLTRAAVVQFVVPGTLDPKAPTAGYDSNLPDVDQPATDAVRVTVTVSWTSRGQAESVSLDTVIAGIRREGPEVEASGSALGADVAGVTFQDGATRAPVEALVAEASVAFREVTESSSQASADGLEVVEIDPATNSPLQTLPVGDESSASAPNSTSGSQQIGPSSPLTAGTMYNLNEAVVLPIAAWGSATPGAATQARVSPSHIPNPEGLAQARATDVLVDARDPGEELQHAVLELGTVVSVVDQRSTVSSTTVVSTVDISPLGGDPGVAVWAAPQFLGHPDFRGVVTIVSIHLDVTSQASGTNSGTVVSWQITGLSVWDPELQSGQGQPGGYTAPVTFGSASADPNPVVIPQAYVGDDGESLSLSIVVGPTVEESSADAAAGIANASAALDLLSISTRDDLAGAVALEPMLASLGSATTTVSYVSHEH